MSFVFRELKENEEVECFYKGFYRSVGAFHKPVHYFKDFNDEGFHIWGSVMLNHLLYGVPFGSKIKLTYIGFFKTDESRYPLKHFKIDIIAPPSQKEV